MAPEGSGLLTLDVLSLQTALEGPRPIVWMVIGMIKAHSTEHRMRLGFAVDGGPCAGQVRLIGGGAQCPWRAAGWGAYSRMVTPNGPRGAGSQFDSLSAPGSWCWM